MWKFSFLILSVCKMKSCLFKKHQVPEPSGWGCRSLFSSSSVFDPQHTVRCSGFHLYKVIESIDVLGKSPWLRRTALWWGLDTINCLTLGESFNLGQAEFLHPWNEGMAVLWDVISDFRNLSAFFTSLVGTCNSFILFYRGKETNSLRFITCVSF